MMTLPADDQSVPSLWERTLPGLHEALIRRLPKLNVQDPILDVGCGTGAWLERLAKLGFLNLHGIDLDIGQFSSTRAQVTQVDLDSDEPRLVGKRFKLITAIEVVEHLENPGRLFKFVSDHLEDDGVFIITTPNIHSIICRLRFLVTGEMRQFDSRGGDPTHIYPVLYAGLNRILPRYRLQISQHWSFPDDDWKVGSNTAARVVAAVLRLLVPEDLPGDTLCLAITRRSS